MSRGVALAAVLTLCCALIMVEFLFLRPARPAARPLESGFLSSCHHLRSVDLPCPRFLSYAINRSAGLGHKVTEVLFSWRMSKALNATFAFDFSPFSNSVHHSYDWAVSYLGLTEGEVVSRSAVLQLFNLTVVNLCPYHAPPSHPECHVLFHVPSFDCCSTNCFLTMAGLFEEEKQCVRAKHRFANSRTFAKRPFLNPESISVVWHVRAGDIVLHARDKKFFSEVWNTLSLALAQLPVHNYFCVENMTAAHQTFPFLWAFPNASVVSPSVIEAMMLFHGTDVLIGSGSSFPQIAALSSEQMLFLNHEPKHQYHGLEYMSDTPYLHRNGTITLAPQELRKQILEKACARRAALGLTPLWWSSCLV